MTVAAQKTRSQAQTPGAELVLDHDSRHARVLVYPSLINGREASPLLLPDLLNDFDCLAGLLPEQVRTGGWLNAFLLAAGLNQIAEDYLHPDPLSLGRAAGHLARLPQPVGPVSAALAKGLKAGLSEAWARTPGAARMARWQSSFASLVWSLARLASAIDQADEERQEQLLARTKELLAATRFFPEGLRRSILRLPSSFRSFDQHPEDLKRLVHDFALQVPDRNTPIVSIGLRTSGSYLAPLVAAYLQGQGYEHVELLTVRPGRHLLPRERLLLSRLGRAGAVALVTDDPPATGGSLAEATAELEHAGIDRQSIVLLLPLFDQANSLPEPVAHYRSFVLPWEDWSVNRRLAPEEMRQTLTELLGPAARVINVQEVDRAPRRWERSHAHGLYRVEVSAAHSGETRPLMVGVKGAGLGYFGEHALAVAERLGEYLPETYGLRDGLLYRAWLDEDLRAAGGGVPARILAEGIAGYVAARARRLPVERDRARDLVGRGPAWEAAANRLCRAYGRLGMPMRPIALDAVVKQLLTVEHPAVIDGAMDLTRWFAGPDGAGSLLKIDPDERAFSNLDLACYDPVFDLAGAAVSADGNDWPDELRRAYEAASGDSIDEERWLLYQLLQLWERGRTGYMEERAVDRTAARALQRYYAARYLEAARRGAGADASGPLVALDLDGVLESQVLGFPGLTPASAEALAALLAHCYRPVLVTGRSLDEVRERCDAYRLAGGAAEYGSVVYLEEGDRTIDLLRPEERDALERLRIALRQMPGVELDPAYQRAVRAFRTKPRGDPWRHRRALTRDQVQAALNAAGVDGAVRSVTGYFQTDFVAARIDKGVGLRVLAAELKRAEARAAGAGELRAAEEEPGDEGQERDALVALAVGDTEADIPMLALAKHAWAPAQADSALRRAGVRVARRPYQAGLAEGVRAVVGHKPGRCADCRVPELPHSARLLAGILGAQENGSAATVWRGLRLVVAARSIPLGRKILRHAPRRPRG